MLSYHNSGFVVLPELLEESPYVNYGLQVNKQPLASLFRSFQQGDYLRKFPSQDQQAAIRWVKENAEAFGGASVYIICRYNSWKTEKRKKGLLGRGRLRR